MLLKENNNLMIDQDTAQWEGNINDFICLGVGLGSNCFGPGALHWMTKFCKHVLLLLCAHDFTNK